MAFKTSTNSALGVPAIALYGVDSIARLPIGTIARGVDDVLGEAEFMYLPGSAGVIAGDVVVVDLSPGAASVGRAQAGTHNNLGMPLAVAVAATPAGSFGWFQISGCAIANVTAGTAAGRMFLTDTAGSVTSGATAGAQVISGRISSAVGTPAAGQSYVTINRPCVQTQIA